MSGEAPAIWSGLFTVEGYSQTKGILGIGNSFNSNVFVVGGYGWRIENYPDGYTQANANYIGFGLGLDRPPDAADDDEEDVVKAHSPSTCSTRTECPGTILREQPRQFSSALGERGAQILLGYNHSPRVEGTTLGEDPPFAESQIFGPRRRAHLQREPDIWLSAKKWPHS
jgi:hypothetical protein